MSSQVLVCHAVEEQVKEVHNHKYPSMQKNPKRPLVAGTVITDGKAKVWRRAEGRILKCFHFRLVCHQSQQENANQMRFLFMTESNFFRRNQRRRQPSYVTCGPLARRIR